MFRLTDSQKVVLTVAAVSAAGNPAPWCEEYAIAGRIARDGAND